MVILTLYTSELPIEVKKALTNQEVMETETAVFECQLSKPNQEVQWSVNGKPIQPSEKYITEVDGDIYKLTIKDCTMDDTAEVTIRTKDCQSNAKLVVTGKIWNIAKYLPPYFT